MQVRPLQDQPNILDRLVALLERQFLRCSQHRRGIEVEDARDHDLSIIEHSYEYKTRISPDNAAPGDCVGDPEVVPCSDTLADQRPVRAELRLPAEAPELAVLAVNGTDQVAHADHP